jgi:hypothetical protein
VLLVLAPLASLSLEGQEHGRTIPLADLVEVISRGPVMTLSAISRPPIDALLDATSATIAAPNWLHLW